MPDPSPEAITRFIERWEKSGAAERANYALFLSELCDILDVPRPDPAGPDTAANLYTFERAVTRKLPDGSTTPGFIDLYKAGAFVLETKQGTTAKAEGETSFFAIEAPAAAKQGHGKRGSASFDKALQRAYYQARGYVTALPASDGRPPFLIVCDVGHSLDLYAEFSGTGGQYERFPDPVSHRITLPDLHRQEIRERLRKVWLDPHSLDPSKHSAAVTREVAKALAELAKSLERDGHDAQVTAGFLQRCLFTMFAEDVGLLPDKSFFDLLEKVKASPAGFPVMLSTLWRDMANGTEFSTVLLGAIPHFNGGLFEDTTALPLRPEQMALLVHAAKSDWSAVEPAIFGTLVERALDPRERHKLGAHYTPRSYVERLIRPALIDPLREEWETVKAAASLANEKANQAEAAADEIAEDAKRHIQALNKAKAGESNKRLNEARKEAAKHHEEAIGAVRDFHRKLCTLRVLDPACGSGNFLYVSLELMKRLEAEVIEAFQELGGDAGFEMATFKIGPRQFLGLELNRRAVAIAQLVLWIGFFQWQRKTTGKADTNERPLLPKEASIVQRDAVLAYDAAIPRRNPDTGEVVTIWDGSTTKPHPITGKEVPDESARKTVFDYTKPRRAEWPECDVIVGNPPFIGTKRMIDLLGEGYTETLRKAWKGSVPDSADFVMYWWQNAAELMKSGKAKRFGFITTNSIHQTFNRRVIEPFLGDEKKPLHLSYAIPDHPWVDSSDGAAVRIAMTVAEPGKLEGTIALVIDEIEMEDGENVVALSESQGFIGADLKSGANLTSVRALLSNSGIAGMGVALHGSGFILEPELAAEMRKSGSAVVKPYLGGADLVRSPRERYLIDFSFISEADALEANPVAFQHVLNHVKPERDQNRREALKKYWWRFGWERPVLRKALVGIQRYLGTTETSKHRIFQFIPVETLADHMIVCVSSDDAFFLGVLSSAPHLIWGLARGGTLEDRPRYNKSVCFDPFPFPSLEESPLKQRIRELGERLDAHRKTHQALHPDLTLTGLYNVLEAVRAGTPLTAKEKAIHDKGLVSILRQIHEDLDLAVLEAYGWDDLFTLYAGAYDPIGTPECKEAFEQAILSRLVALNHQRAAEEKRGLIRWLRPDYQAPNAGAAPQDEQDEIDLPAAKAKPAKAAAAEKLAWPEGLAAQVAVIRKLLPTNGPKPEGLSNHFGKKSAKRTQQITEILETLRGLGKL